MNGTTAPRLAVRGDQNVGWIKVSGIVGAATMREVKAAMSRLALREGTRRVLVDLSCAVLTLTEGEWGDFSDACSSQHAMRLPSAYLVNGPQISHAWDHCDRMNAAGRICLTFRASRDAYQWLGASASELERLPEATYPG